MGTELSGLLISSTYWLLFQQNPLGATVLPWEWTLLFKACQRKIKIGGKQIQLKSARGGWLFIQLFTIVNAGSVQF